MYRKVHNHFYERQNVSILQLLNRKTLNMTSTVKNSTAIDWIIFLVSTVLMIFLLMYADEWFWLALPFSLTYLVKALDMM